MKAIKHDKVQEILHRLAAEFIRDEASPASLITITRVELTPAGRNAVIYFTTLPEREEDTALKFLDRKTPDFKHHVIEKSRLGLVPHLSFKIDYGERNRQRLDVLSREEENS